ncbi:hypothetical protein [uncultured Acetatifactor sp.]|jgi:hypothetical protein|uniref:hypothetical protein n=1 Tax=uncultured Acetatifactor sp. TaxID=1671927 RepID=UPI0026112CD5|nr:hypothetical protein [uncultured Acetatifactor sp.]
MICKKLEECINGELQSNSLERCDNKNRMNCIESSDRRSAVKCEENKKRYVLENTKKTILKGVNVPKALIQIKETLVLYKNVFRKFGHVYARAIVTSSTPNLKASPEYVNLERMIRKDYKGNIKIVERQFNEKDIELGDRLCR